MITHWSKRILAVFFRPRWLGSDWKLLIGPFTLIFFSWKTNLILNITYAVHGILGWCYLTTLSHRADLGGCWSSSWLSEELRGKACGLVFFPGGWFWLAQIQHDRLLSSSPSRSNEKVVRWCRLLWWGVWNYIHELKPMNITELKQYEHFFQQCLLRK